MVLKCDYSMKGNQQCCLLCCEGGFLLFKSVDRPCSKMAANLLFFYIDVNHFRVNILLNFVRANEATRAN